ncbi:ABC transporter substrate-binding protein [Specibacter sp. NPDC078709]|uniref:ABC transporter substrate-binding protein n=1 Tax=Specibacter sp. NPDC078709 TaxID=3154364 RepID=UPI0034364EBE
MFKKTLAALAAVALIGGLAACGNAGGNTSAGNPDGIKFNWGVPQAAYLTLYVADEKGYFKDEGLDPQFQVFQTGAPLLAGLESNSLDVVTTGLATIFALGKDIPLRYIVAEGNASATEGLVVSADSPIKKVTDLAKAGKIGVPTGTCAQISAYWAAEAAGVKYADLDIVNITPNLFGNAFASKSIDAGISWAPYLADLEQQGQRIVGHDNEWVPGGAACPEMHAGNPAFLDANPEVPKKMIAALGKAWNDIKADPSVATEALMTKLHVTKPVAEATAKRYIETYPTLEDQLDPSNIFSFSGDKGLFAQLNLASTTFATLGVIKEPVPEATLRKALDPQYIEAAVKAGK